MYVYVFETRRAWNEWFRRRKKTLVLKEKCIEECQYFKKILWKDMKISKSRKRKGTGTDLQVVLNVPFHSLITIKD